MLLTKKVSRGNVNLGVFPLTGDVEMIFQTVNDGPCNCGYHDLSKALHNMACCAYSGMPRAESESRAQALRAQYGEDITDKPPKYSIGQRVRVNGWVGHDFGTVIEIKRTYHNRCARWTWGYQMKYENHAPLAFEFVPQGYLSES